MKRERKTRKLIARTLPTGNNGEIHQGCLPSRPDFDFESAVRSGYYERLERSSNTSDKLALRLSVDAAVRRFQADAAAYAVSMGVPLPIASKVVAKAWQDGHAFGYNEVLNSLDELIPLFEGLTVQA